MNYPIKIGVFDTTSGYDVMVVCAISNSVDSLIDAIICALGNKNAQIEDISRVNITFHKLAIVNAFVTCFSDSCVINADKNTVKCIAIEENIINMIKLAHTFAKQA